MANLRGTGSMKAVNLVAVTYANSKTKDGKSQYMDVQVDARDSRGPGQTNLHLVTERVKDKDGKDRINNGAPYSTAQFEAIKEAAGANHVTLPNGAQVYAVKADLMPSRKSGLVLNSKTVEASEHTIDDKVIDNQFASVKAAKETAKAAAAEAAVVAEAQAVVEAPAAEAAEVSLDKADEPALA